MMYWLKGSHEIQFAEANNIIIVWSKFRGVRVPFSKEPGTRLKNHFWAFSDTLVSEYNLSFIL